MSRPKNKHRDTDQTARPGVRTKIYVRDDMIGGGKVDLLRLVAETGSISKAARKMGVGYRRAWFLLETLQRCFAEPLFTTTRGSSGGADLTETGLELLRRHDEHEKQIQEISKDFLDWLANRQPPQPDHPED